MVVIVMGVSGVGKTVVGRLVAATLVRPFLDADDLHTSPNLARMAAGEPLGEAERRPWIGRLHATLGLAVAAGEEPVLACSALRAEHRVLLAAGLPVSWLHLTAPVEVIEGRLRDRRSDQPQAVGTELLASQLATLDAPDDRAGSIAVIDATGSPEQVARLAVAEVNRLEGSRMGRRHQPGGAS